MTERPENQPKINIDLITDEFLQASRESFFELFSDPGTGGISDR